MRAIGTKRLRASAKSLNRDLHLKSMQQPQKIIVKALAQEEANQGREKREENVVDLNTILFSMY